MLSTPPALFGTDGIRGCANTGFLTPRCLISIAQAISTVLQRNNTRHKVVIGKDTRLSGYLIESALTSGFVSMGMDVILVGPMPTPAVALLTRSLRADIGIMISASHNPYDDNGIKIFGREGAKITIKQEKAIEKAYYSHDSVVADSHAIGRVERLREAYGRYIESVKATFPRGKTLDGLRVVLDCANGAAYHVAPLVLRELGAEVILTGASPDGFNINQGCGSTDPSPLCALVVEHKADIGMALDGDGDRVLMCDEKGAIIAGEQFLALIAQHWHDKHLFANGSIVSTILANHALETFLAKKGMTLLRSQVGDKHVATMMHDNGCVFGGEPSGHFIFHNHSATGDGLVAALQMLAILREAGTPASESCHPLVLEPREERIVKSTRGDIRAIPSVRQAIDSLVKETPDGMYVIIRPSGTEPVIRVTVEGKDPAAIAAHADALCHRLQALA